MWFQSSLNVLILTIIVNLGIWKSSVIPIRLQNTIKIKITCTHYFKDFKLLYSLSSCLQTCYFSSLWYIHTHKCPCIILWNNLIRSTIPGYPGAQISRFPLSKSLILHYWLHDSEQTISPSWVHNANSLSPPFCIPLLHSRLSVSLRPENQRLFILIFVIVEQGQHKPYSFFGEIEFHFPLLGGGAIFFPAIGVLISLFFLIPMTGQIPLMTFYC